ncbi:bifunctional metallophosphatase/5'-nucleotidase [Rhodocaloribacter sp.]
MNRPMNSPFRLLPLVLAFLLLAGCGGAKRAVAPGAEASPEPVVTVTILQMNDVYEITPIEAGRRGGLARVATLRKRLLEKNPNTLTVLAGDFFSPSAMGTAKVDGERLAGRQMVAVLNTLGLDLATFGNHEFDLKADAFYERLAESRFVWTSANVTDTLGRPFPGVRPEYVWTATGPDGRAVRIGFVSVTLPANRKPYVRYTDPVATMKEAAERLAPRVDAVVGLTHVALDTDAVLAGTVPALDLVLGGHEHENYYLMRGSGDTPILKADANARSVYVHELHVNTATGEVSLDSRFVPVTDAIAEDPETAAEVKKWVDRAYAGFRAEGFEPEAVVATTTVPLDGREASVRNRTTRLTELIAEAMLHAAEGAELAVYNGGSIRIDDVLPPGPVTQYDVIRVLPFGGDVVTVAIRGDVLARALDQGVKNRGTGGFLQTANVTRDEEAGRWLIDGEPLRPDRTYTVATSDFLVSGRETGLGFFSLDNPGITRLRSNGDVRAAVIAELERRFGGS